MRTAAAAVKFNDARDIAGCLELRRFCFFLRL